MNTRERTEQIRLAVDGDRDAMQRLIVLYHEPLHASVKQRIKPSMCSQVDPNDILQEAYAAAYKSIGLCNFAGPAPFYTWLELIALNKLRDRQKALKAKKAAPTEGVQSLDDRKVAYPELAETFGGRDRTPSRELKKREAVAAVLSSLARLTDDQRDVIRLRFLESLSVEEVARRLGKTKSSVYKLISRGLRELRESLGSITRFLTQL